jgi:hypothetical protein
MAHRPDGKRAFSEACDAGMPRAAAVTEVPNHRREPEMTIDPDESALATSMVEVHGAEAAAVARGNARGAALAGAPMQARSWIRVLSIIQRRRAGTPPEAASGRSPPT